MLQCDNCWENQSPNDDDIVQWKSRNDNKISISKLDWERVDSTTLMEQFLDIDIILAAGKSYQLVFNIL